MGESLWNTFAAARPRLERQYLDFDFDPDTGLDCSALNAEAEALLAARADCSPMRQKALLFELVVTKGRICVDAGDWFADKLQHGDILQRVRAGWHRHLLETRIPSVQAQATRMRELGVYETGLDLGHVSPDWERLLQLGPRGLRDEAVSRRNQAQAAGALTPEQRDFYDAVEIVYGAEIRFFLRLAAQADRVAQRAPEHAERLGLMARALRNIAARPPQTLHEALQLAYIHHELQEMEGENVRSMGGFDRLYFPFYQRDLEQGRLTRAQAKELIQYFFIKFFARTQGMPYGKNFYFGGILPDGRDAVNDLSYAALEAYREMRTVDPKLSMRIHSGTPDAFLRLVAECIRAGCTSIVLSNDEVQIKTMLRHGKTLAEAREYQLIGCYEPAVAGKEICCSMAIQINVAKVVELALNNGVDPRSGTQVGPATGDAAQFTSFEAFQAAFDAQLVAVAEKAMAHSREFDRDWPAVNPSPFFSGTMLPCMESGRDVSANGAKYNNSGCMCGCFANAADSLMAVKQLVFAERRVTLPQLRDILAANWEGAEELRFLAQERVPKWGNNQTEVDRLACAITELLARTITGKPNSRGGIFQAALFSIDYSHRFGRLTGALPDGRRDGEPLAKNCGAMIARDKRGVTALIHSVTKLDFTGFPDGSVLDILLHPTAVQGEEGLQALMALIRTYFARGGVAIQFNIFDANTLRDAQRRPESYANLQVRVCGWNVHFINLSRPEQEEFIQRAEAANA